MELKTYFAQDRTGNLIPSATVSIYLTGTTTLATGLKNVSGGNLANPFSADADGKIQFYAPDGIYDMQVSLGSTTGVKVTFQCLDVQQQLTDANSAADRAENAAESIEDQTATITANTREQWRRALADAGLSLVSGSFEEGATATTTIDAVWNQEGGQCYTWGGTLPKTVPANSTPGSTGGVSSGAWVSVAGVILRSDLLSEVTSLGDNLITVKQPISNSSARKLHDWVSDHISVTDMAGVVGDGVNDDAPGIIAAITALSAAKKPVVFVPGTYLISTSITFNTPVKIHNGAVLKARNGAVIRFNAEIQAGEYKVFDTNDDFVSNYLQVPSVKIAMGPVRPEWFGARTVSSYAELATSIDCSSAFHKAWHATCGEFNVELTPGSFYQSEFYHSYILLAAGKYRIDNNLKFWYRVTSPSVIRYNKNGGGIVGAGMGLSVIVLTNPADESNAAMEFSDMSGELHMFRDFKVTFYDFNATGDARWFGRTGAGILFSSSDSIYTLNLWAAGFKYLKLDGDGVRRGGVGIQFESLVDHFYGNLLTEHCVHGVAFSSCVSNGYNAKGFVNTVADISCGNFIPAWPDLIDQTGINLIALSGLESKACPATPIYFGTADNRVSITNVNVKGNGESSSAVVTYRVIDFNPAGGGASGLIQGNAMNVNYGLIDDRTTGFAGRDGRPLRLVFNLHNVAGASSTETAVAVFRNPLSNIDVDMGIDGAKSPALISNCNHAKANLNLNNISGYTQAPYAAFICGAGKLLIQSLKVNATTNATYLGYAGGSAQVILPAAMDVDIAPVRKGSGSTADIRQVSSATYSTIQ
ncbi:tail spike protein [Enterobacter phage Arya]|uniref:Pectate lyase superfamily protein domain-containing protein n=1 Tax=Enterobacter phage Arya TaxID=1864622 RepID=A0A193GYB8_9CAUD|nr:tail spike protein [Enterobacter phage Arya]ANN86123.1 hypothetical protein BI096_gp15 [Enterobacter phage Arya]